MAALRQAEAETPPSAPVPPGGAGEELPLLGAASAEAWQALPFEFFPAGDELSQGGRSSDSLGQPPPPPPFLDFSLCGLDSSVADEEWKRALAPIGGRAGDFVRFVAAFYLGYQGLPGDPSDAYREVSPTNLSRRRYEGRVYLDWKEIKQKQQMLPEGTPFCFHLNETNECRFVSKLLEGSGEMRGLVKTLVDEYRACHVQVNVNGHDVPPNLLKDTSSEKAAKVLRDLCWDYPDTLFLVPITDSTWPFFEQIVTCGPPPPNLCGVFTSSAGEGVPPPDVPRINGSYPTGTGRRVGFSGGINGDNAKYWLDCYANRAREHRCRLVLETSSGFRQDSERGRPIDGRALRELTGSVHKWAMERAEHAGSARPEWRTWLGDWYSFIHPDARKLMEDLMVYVPPQKVRGRDFAESALKELRFVSCQWFFALALPFVVSHWLCVCPEEGYFASYSPLVWVLVAPVLAYVVYCEVRVLKWTLASLAQYCAPFKVGLLGEVSFVTWLLIAGTLAFLGHLDIFTTGLFLAKMLKTAVCCTEEASQIKRMWATSIHRSAVFWVPYLDRFVAMLLAGWSLIFLQPLQCALCTAPLHRLTKVERMKKGYSTLWSRGAKWLNRAHDKAAAALGFEQARLRLSEEAKEVRVYPADALQSLGILNRMYTVIGQNLRWTIRRAEEELGTDKEGRYLRALDMVNRELSRVIRRLWFKHLVQDVFIVETNVTIFAVSRCLLPRDSEVRVDWQLLLSLSISVISFVKSINSIYDDLKAIHSFTRGMNPPASVEMQSDVQSQRRELRELTLLCILGLVCMLGWLAHSLTKFAMAFACEDSIWDIPYMSSARGMDWKGCVDVREILAGRP